MIALTFPIHLLEPLLATTLEGDPNSAVSLPFIPGSALRGALVARYLQQHAVADLAGDAALRALFIDGSTCYLNACPLDPRGQPTWPTPLAWYRAKGQGDESPVYDLSVDPRDGEEWQPQAIRAPFCRLEGNQVTFYDPQRQINVHTQRDRVLGRATETSGAVFRYEALAAGQTFGGVILCPDAQAADRLQPLLDGTLWLGGSHNAGYGCVQLGPVVRREGWFHAPPPQSDLLPGSTLTVTMLSDAVLRDAHGQPLPFLTAEWLSARLGVPLTLLPERTFAKMALVGGFNRKWGLPLPQMPAARAGSVYTFKVQEMVPVAKLTALMEQGIGERRAEGFGRLAVNMHAQYDRLDPQEPPMPDKARLPLLTGDDAAQARRMAERLLRRNLDRRLLERVNDLTARVDLQSFPANSQLGQIGALIRSALFTGDPAPIRQRLSAMREKARKQFDAAWLEDRSLSEWIVAHLTDDRNQVWRWLYQTPYSSDGMPSVGGVRAELTDDLAREYALRLVDGVLKGVMARRRKEGKQ